MFTLYDLLSDTITTTVFRGSFFLLLLFTFCFSCIHLIIRLIGRRVPRSKPPEPKPTQPVAPPVAPEPVYYIVERKRRPTKAKYGEPKEIKFK